MELKFTILKLVYALKIHECVCVSKMMVPKQNSMSKKFLQTFIEEQFI